MLQLQVDEFPMTTFGIHPYYPGEREKIHQYFLDHPETTPSGSIKNEVNNPENPLLYSNLTKQTPDEMKSLYKKYGKSMFYGADRHKPESERISLYLSKIFYVFALRDNDKIYAYDGQFGKYVEGDTIIATWLGTVFPEINTPALFQKVLHQLRSLTYRYREDIISPRNIIPFSNGNLEITVDPDARCFLVDDVWLSPFTPDTFFFNRLPVPYITGVGDCPIYDSFMAKAMSAKDVEFLNEYFGSMLWRDIIYPLSAWLVGNSKTGKSTLLNLATYILGKDNIAEIPMHDFNEKFELVQLENKFANIVPDMSCRIVKDTSRFKAAISGDMLKGRELFKNSHIFTGFAKHIFAMNILPVIKDVSDSFFDRTRLVFFTGMQYFFGDGNCDPHLIEKLKAEAPAIVSSRWLPAMINAVNRNYYINQDFWESTKNKWLSNLELECQ